MKRPDNEAHVVVLPTGKGTHPWVMVWKAPQQFLQRSFATREEAVEAAQQVAIGSPPFDCDMAVYPAKLPFTTAIPSTQTIEAWMEVADQMLAAVLAKRGAN
jgi:hypothetical protein